jgi:gamma-glutamylcysteine synthetase
MTTSIGIKHLHHNAPVVLREIMAQEIEKSNALGVSTSDVINFGSNSLIDLTGMPLEQIAELKRQYASGMINLKRKAENLKIENA